MCEDHQEGEFETFAPVVSWSTIRLVLISTMIQDWIIICIDFSNAFVQATLMSADDVSQLASRLEKRTVPISIPTGVVLNIQGLCFWAGKARRQGRILYAGEFNAATLASVLDDMEIEDAQDNSPDIKPDILKEDAWEDWSQEFPTYLSNIMGKQRIALDYVI